MELPIDYTSAHWTERKAAREEYIRLQNGLCFWCEQPLKASPSPEVVDSKINWSLFPPQFMAHPIHLQHCHKTGMTEGAVHAKCNAFMFQYHGR